MAATCEATTIRRLKGYVGSSVADQDLRPQTAAATRPATSQGDDRVGQVRVRWNSPGSFSSRGKLPVSRKGGLECAVRAVTGRNAVRGDRPLLCCHHRFNGSESRVSASFLA